MLFLIRCAPLCLLSFLVPLLSGLHGCCLLLPVVSLNAGKGVCAARCDPWISSLHLGSVVLLGAVLWVGHFLGSVG